MGDATLCHTCSRRSATSRMHNNPYVFWFVSLLMLTIGCSQTDSVSAGHAAMAGLGTSGAGAKAGSNAFAPTALAAGVAGSANPVRASPPGAGADAAALAEAGVDAAVMGMSAGAAGSTPAVPMAGSASMESGTTPSVAQIAASLADAICAALNDCLGAQKLSALSGREPCAARLAAMLAQNDLGGLDQSIQQGRVQQHSDLLEACYEDVRALGCAIQTVRLPAACRAAIAGQVAAGGVCDIGSDCAGEAFCPLQCPRQCTPVAAQGGACLRDEECKMGLICDRGFCAPPTAEAAACGGSTGAACAFGASCVGGSNTLSGVCASNASIQSGAVGAACSPSGMLCKEGLSCAWNGASGFSCQTAVGSGASCHLSLPSQCPLDQYCSAPDTMTPGQCAALPSDGQNCVLAGQCAPRHLCVSENSQAVCRRIGDLGDPCSGDPLCRSGSCEAGRCVVRAACL